MDAEDQTEVGSHGSLFPLLSAARSLNPFSLLDPYFRRGFFNGLTSAFTTREPFVSHPREVRDIPIDFADRNVQLGHSELRPVIEDVTGTTESHGQGNVIIDDDGEEQYNSTHINNLNYNDTEEEMIQAAIEASWHEAKEGYPNNQFGASNGLLQRQLDLDDEFAHAVSLSLKTAEEEKAMRECLKDKEQILGVNNSADVEDRRNLTNGSLKIGSSSHGNDYDPGTFLQHRGDVFHSDEWGGISSEERDAAVGLEATFFSGISEGASYRFPYTPHQQTSLDNTAGPNFQAVPGPPSPSLSEQQLLGQEQDNEYLASLQADREKVVKAVKEAETRLLDKGDSFWIVQEEEEFQRRLDAKEASLPQEPQLEDGNAVALLVRMPDGSRHGRRFLKSDKLQTLFDFIDVGKAVKPGTYRVVMSYPQRAFSVDDSSLTLNELGLTSKQEALFIELV